MDKLINVLSSGTQQIMQAQAVYLNNLANQSTAGFREDFVSFQTKSMSDVGLSTRSYSVSMPNKYNFSTGSLVKTDRDLDVAIQDKGWFVVKNAKGEEAYTRDGGFKLDSKGILTSAAGLKVMGQKGPITIRNGSRVDITSDGTISIVSEDDKKSVQKIDKIKLVNPDTSILVKREDGLFYRTDNNESEVDPKIKVSQGFIEGSNVNPIETLTRIIDLSRQYESQMKLMNLTEKNADSNADLTSV